MLDHLGKENKITRSLSLEAKSANLQPTGNVAANRSLQRRRRVLLLFRHVPPGKSHINGQCARHFLIFLTDQSVSLPVTSFLINIKQNDSLINKYY